ncbi:hypothetical protein [Nocardiopsis coralliicola]
MTDNTEAARGPVRPSPVLSSTGNDAPAAPATGTGSIGAPAAPAPPSAATPQPPPAAAAAATDTDTDTGRGRRALLTALALRSSAANAPGAADTDADRHRPGRPTLAVAGIAGLLLVAAPFGMSAAQEYRGAAPLDGDTASGTTQDHAYAGSDGAAQPQAPDTGAGAGAGTGSAGGAEGYVPQVLPDSPGSGDGGGQSGEPRGEGGGGGDGGGGNGTPVPPGPTDEDEDEDGSDGSGGDDNETPTLEIEQGSFLAGLLSDREEREDRESSSRESGSSTGDGATSRDSDTGDEESRGSGSSSDDTRSDDSRSDSQDSNDSNDSGGEGSKNDSGSGPETRSGGTPQDDSSDTEKNPPADQPQTQQNPEPEPFRAVAGPGCTSEGARYQVNGDNVRRDGPAGYNGAGCDDAYDVAPVSGDPGNSTSAAQWTFWPGRPGATCTVKILVQNGAEPLWENGIPAHYEVFDADNSNGSPRGGFDVTRPDGGRYWAMTELEDVGESFTLRTTNAAADPDGGGTPEHPYSVVEAECS